jgi:hypothetical protein
MGGVNAARVPRVRRRETRRLGWVRRCMTCRQGVTWTVLVAAGGRVDGPVRDGASRGPWWSVWGASVDATGRSASVGVRGGPTPRPLRSTASGRVSAAVHDERRGERCGPRWADGRTPRCTAVEGAGGWTDRAPGAVCGDAAQGPGGAGAMGQRGWAVGQPVVLHCGRGAAMRDPGRCCTAAEVLRCATPGGAACASGPRTEGDGPQRRPAATAPVGPSALDRGTGPPSRREVLVVGGRLLSWRVRRSPPAPMAQGPGERLTRRTGGLPAAVARHAEDRMAQRSGWRPQPGWLAWPS